MTFWRHPQTTPLRRALFQLHLWTGLAVGLYVLVIGLTGTILVFRPALQAHAYPQFFAPRPPATALADPAAVIASLEASYPGYRFSGIDYPTTRRGTFLAYLARGDGLHTVFSDPVSGKVIGELPRDGWIQQLQELHFNLWSGSTGIAVNGAASICLLIMCLTGAVIWWPGISRWRRALTVDVRRGWKRIIWEAHGALGIWTVAFLTMWAVTGVYFSFPVTFRNVVAQLVPMGTPETVQSGPPSAAVPPAPAALLARARSRVPNAQPARFVVPNGPRGTYAVVLARDVHGDSDANDEVTVYFDRYSGAELAIRDQSDLTAGNKAMSWLGRLHVGNFGGLPVRVIWAVGGLGFPLLFISGFTMWWNRKLAPARRPARASAAQ